MHVGEENFQPERDAGEVTKGQRGKTFNPVQPNFHKWRRCEPRDLFYQNDMD